MFQKKNTIFVILYSKDEVEIWAANSRIGRELLNPKTTATTNAYKAIHKDVIGLPKIQMGWNELIDYLQAVEIVLFPFTCMKKTRFLLYSIL